jgi:hypothetical protein
MPESAASPQTYSDGQAWLSVAPSLLGCEDWNVWLQQGEQRLEQLAQPSNRVLGTGRGAARAVTFAAHDCCEHGVWRVNRHGGLLGGLQADRYLDFTRLQQEVALSAQLRARGIHTPEVLLAFAKRHGAWWRQHLVTREVEAAQTVFTARESAAAMQASTHLLQQLFDAGLWATDLHPGNLLWQAETGQCWLIDLAGAELRKEPLSAADRKARVERFARFFVKHAGQEPQGMQALRSTLLSS